MKDVLDTLFDTYCGRPQGTAEQERITANHQMLIKRLGRKDRRLVLRIIDDKDMLMEIVSLRAFRIGFEVAMKIFSEMETGSAEEDG